MRQLGVEKFYIELIEVYDNITSRQMWEREGYFIKLYDTYENGYNSQIQGNPREAHYEKARLYKETNKERITLKNKEYNERNKNWIKEKKSQRILCDCGLEFRKADRAQHMRSLRHKNKINNIIDGSKFLVTVGDESPPRKPIA
jgi:hypothetical protein